MGFDLTQISHLNKKESNAASEILKVVSLSIFRATSNATEIVSLRHPTLHRPILPRISVPCPGTRNDKSPAWPRRAPNRKQIGFLQTQVVQIFGELMSESVV